MIQSNECRYGFAIGILLLESLAMLPKVRADDLPIDPVTPIYSPTNPPVKAESVTSTPILNSEVKIFRAHWTPEALQKRVRFQGLSPYGRAQDLLGVPVPLGYSTDLSLRAGYINRYGKYDPRRRQAIYERIMAMRAEWPSPDAVRIQISRRELDPNGFLAITVLPLGEQAPLTREEGVVAGLTGLVMMGTALVPFTGFNSFGLPHDKFRHIDFFAGLDLVLQSRFIGGAFGNRLARNSKSLAFALGILKELVDATGVGTFELGDILADFAGVYLVSPLTLRLATGRYGGSQIMLVFSKTF